MTRGDIYIKIVSEVTGQSEAYVAEHMSVFRAIMPGDDRYDESLPDNEAQELLTELRKEKSGILQWFKQGQLLFHLKRTNPAGEA